jgi:AAHS family 3-hydroxyphenylpropionic acid transporter
MVWTLALCFAAALCEGYDIQSMGLAAPTLAPALHLTRDQLGPVFSISIFGLLVGALLVGRLADRVGRRWTLITSLAVFGGFSLATAWAWDFGSLVAIRLCAGLGLGGAMPNLIALSAEAVSEQNRGRVVTIITAGMPFGGAVAGVVAAAMGWREIFVVGGAAPLALAALMLVWLPESARFQAARLEAAPGASLVKALFGEGRAVTTMVLWLSSFATLLTLYLLLNWLPTLLGAKGLSKPDASLVSVLFNMGGGSATVALASLLRRGRRALTMTLWFAGLAASLVALAWSGPGLAATGAAGFAVGAFASGASLMLYGLAPGFYAVTIRGAGTGAAVAVGRFGAIVGPLMAAALLSAGAAAGGVLLSLLPLVAISWGTALVLLRRPTVAD